MADLALTNGGELFLHISDIRPGLAGAGGLAFLDSVYLDPTTGTYLKTNSNAAGKYQFRGVVVGPYAGAGAGQAVDILEEGYVAGFDVSALAFDALVYVSDTAGKLGTAAGSNSSVVGRVVALTDKDASTGKPSKVLYVRPSVI